MLFPLALALAAAAQADSVPARHAVRLLGEPITTISRAISPGPHRLTLPEEVGLKGAELTRARETIAAEIQRGGLPGASVAIGRWDQTVVEEGIGRLDWSAGSASVDPDLTIYDLASLTKVVATTTAVMLLVEDGRMELDAPVQRYLPEFAGVEKSRVTVRHLLAHTSGLPAGADIWSQSPQGALDRALRVGLVRPAGAGVEYSDVGFIVLYAAAERAAGEPLYRLLDRRVFGPLKMRSTTFMPGAWCERCAPTHLRPDGTVYRGVVHDPMARQLGGIAGNAGLFSTVHDLARFAAMLAREGELDGARILKAETIREFTRRQPGARTRALGWDTPSASGGGAAGLRISPRAYGHTGFTGTSLWIDPDRGTWTVLLTNRTFQPRAPNRIQNLRRSVHDAVATAADDL